MSRSMKSIVAVVCSLVVLATLPANAQSKKDSKAAEKFRSQGEASRKAVEDVRSQLEKTLQAYDALLNTSEKKLASAHKKLTSELDKTDKAVQSGRKTITEFQAGAEAFFAIWEGNLDSISTPTIREASAKRLGAAQASFQAMADNLAAAKEAYEPMMASLNEQATLLSQDLTADTVEMMSTDVAPEVRAQGTEVLASLDRILNKEQAQEAEIDEILDEEEAENPSEAMDEDSTEEEDDTE